MAARGLSNDEIAEQLFLGAHDQAQLVVIDYQSGLVQPT